MATLLKSVTLIKCAAFIGRNKIAVSQPGIDMNVKKVCFISSTACTAFHFICHSNKGESCWCERYSNVQMVKWKSKCELHLCIQRNCYRHNCNSMECFLIYFMCVSCLYFVVAQFYSIELRRVEETVELLFSISVHKIGIISNVLQLISLWNLCKYELLNEL